MYKQFAIGNALSHDGKCVTGKLSGKITAICKMRDGSFQYRIMPPEGRARWCIDVEVK